MNNGRVPSWVGKSDSAGCYFLLIMLQIVQDGSEVGAGATSQCKSCLLLNRFLSDFSKRFLIIV